MGPNDALWTELASKVLAEQGISLSDRALDLVRLLDYTPCTDAQFALHSLAAKGKNDDKTRCVAERVLAELQPEPEEEPVRMPELPKLVPGPTAREIVFAGFVLAHDADERLADLAMDVLREAGL